MRNMAFIIRTTVLMMEEKYGFGKTIQKQRDLFGKSKTAPTEEEREQARKEYLDRRGVPESFRW